MRFFCVILLLVLSISCNNSEVTRTKLIHYVPKNASIIIRANNIEDLKSSINNNDLLKKLSNITLYEHVEAKLENLSLIKPSGDLLICFSKNDADSLHYTIITNYNNDLFVTDSLKNYKEETLTYQSKSIVKSNYNNHTFYSASLGDVFIASSSIDIINDAHLKTPVDAQLERVFSTTTTDKTISVIIKGDNPFIKSFAWDDSLPLKTFTNYIALDIDINQNHLLFNGVTQSLDSLNTINIFKNTIPQENQIQHITPYNSDGFMSFTFNDYEILKTNLSALNKKDSIAELTTLFNDIHEIGVIYSSNKRAIVLNSLDIIATKEELLGEQNMIETFRDTEIFNFSSPDLFSKALKPLITFNNVTKYCVLDNFFVFADDSELLHEIITSYHNKSTLSEQPYYNDIKQQLNDASSLMFVGNASILKTVIEKNLEESLNSDLSNYSASGLQFIFDNNFAHINGIIKQAKIKAAQNTVSEELNIKLDTDLLNTPQFVTNHITKEKEIVVQDIKNNLYLISNKGKVLWKKQVEGPILGTVEQIDIYKNGRLQLVFATPNRVYITDRNGKDVAPFPAKFNDKITQPLSVFDYDKNKNYRFVVTQGKNILMYDVNAKLVNGFTFKSASDNIIHQPQHVRINSKDYITLKTANKLYILDRTGKVRITPKTSTTFSNEPVFLYNDKITTTSAKGDLISIDNNGNTTSLNLQLSENHHIDASSKTLVTLSENKLNIKGKTIELDFGSYTAPRLFYINDKIYVSVTDLQSHKVYLYDSQAEIISHFPVYGNSIAALDIIDNNKNLGLVVKGDDNSIIIYRIN